MEKTPESNTDKKKEKEEIEQNEPESKLVTVVDTIIETIFSGFESYLGVERYLFLEDSRLGSDYKETKKESVKMLEEATEDQ